MAQRIRGQEVKIYVLVNGANVLQGENHGSPDVRSFSITPKFTKLEEQYLGETSKRYDELFDGVDFDMEMHIEDNGVLNFISKVRERATDRTNKTEINIQSDLQFANGVKKTVLLTGCFFENMPLNIGSRSDYVTFKISGSCTDFEVL